MYSPDFDMGPKAEFISSMQRVGMGGGGYEANYASPFESFVFTARETRRVQSVISDLTDFLEPESLFSR